MNIENKVLFTGKHLYMIKILGLSSSSGVDMILKKYTDTKYSGK